jgi:hypothetical protein
MLIRRRNRNAHIRIRIRIRDGGGGEKLKLFETYSASINALGKGEKILFILH